MTKLFLVAAGLFIAASAQADTPPATTPTTPVTPVMTSGEYTTAAPARRGLFARLRNRTMYTRATTATPMTTVTPATPAAPAPMPMKVSGTTPMPTTGVVQTGGTETTTAGTVTTAAYTTPMTAPTARRMGFFRSMFYGR